MSKVERKGSYGRQEITLLRVSTTIFAKFWTSFRYPRGAFLIIFVFHNLVWNLNCGLQELDFWLVLSLIPPPTSKNSTFTKLSKLLDIVAWFLDKIRICNYHHWFFGQKTVEYRKSIFGFCRMHLMNMHSVKIRFFRILTSDNEGLPSSDLFQFCTK